MNKALRVVLLTAFMVTIGMGAGDWLKSAPTVFAHANVASSEPPANAELDVPPEQIVIWFTEPLEPALSQIEVLNSEGSRMDNDDSLIDRVDPSVMSVTLGDLENGTYTVVWKNVSTVDGHRVRGSFIFSVGEPLSGAAPVEIAEQGLLQSPSEPVIRWLVLLGGLALVGGLGFHLLVLRPVLTSQGAPDSVSSLIPTAQILVSRLMLLAAVVAVLASLAQLIVQASVVHEISVADSFGDPVKTILTNTDWGRVWLWRMGALAAALVVVVLVAVLAHRRQDGPLGQLYLPVIAMGLGAGMLFSISWTSHGAAVAGIETTSIVSDFIHLVAASFWVGGILVFLATILLVNRSLSREHRSLALAGVTPRFSAVAVISMGILIITGSYGAWAQVTIVEAFATPYGWSLVGKLALVTVILIIGSFNLLWIRKRLATNPQASTWLGRLIAVEAVVAVLIVVSVGVLTSLEPARQVASREGLGVADYLKFSDTAEGTDIELVVEPGTVGTNRLLITLEDRFGKPLTDAEDVSVDLTSLDVDLGKTTFVSQNLGDGQYVIEEALFNIAGAWQASVIVRRSDAFDARTAFRFIAAKTTSSGSAVIAPDPNKGKFLLGLELFGGAVLFMVAGVAAGGWATRSGRSLLGPGLAVAVLGMVLAVASPVGQTGLDTQTNPFPPDQT
ncbi:MAG: hypothetical protein CL902_10095, partial [Dehalococcoidia bacterium]|nr:hypothetical protein [Dehalococcoidia bacterium]